MNNTFKSLTASLLLCSFETRAQQDTSSLYEDIQPFAGLAVINLSHTSPAPGIFFGVTGGDRHFKYEVHAAFTPGKGGNSGIRYLSAYAHTSPESVEIPFETRSQYRSVTFGIKYYIKNMEINPVHNFYGGVGMTMQYFTITPYGGQYDTGTYYVQDEIYKLNRKNNELGAALRISCGYEYGFTSRVVLFAGAEYDYKPGVTSINGPIFRNVNVFMAGTGLKYKFILSRKVNRH